MINDIRKNYSAYIIAGIFMLIIIGGLVYATIANALAGYSFKSEVTMSNNSPDDYHGRFVITDVNANALVDGGYLQADADDIAYSSGNTEQPMTIGGLEGNNGILIFPYRHLPAYSNAIGYIWTGSRNAANRNQLWICHGSDTMVASSTAMFSLGQTFILEAQVCAVATPTASATRQAIIARPGSWGLYLSSTPTAMPTWIFSINNGITNVTVTLGATLNETGTVSGWYNGINMVLNHTVDGQASGTQTGTPTAYAVPNVHACEFNGYCDDVRIRLP